MRLRIAAHTGCGRRGSFAAWLQTGVMLLALLPAGAGAQNPTGSIYGQTTPGADLSVVVENTGTGFKRELPVDENGRYSFSALPPGNYTVLLRKGAVATKAETAAVVAGVGTAVNFGDASSGPEAIRLDEIEAHGGAIITPIDISTAQTTTIYSAQRMEVIPVAKDITSVALLAPGTTKGDAAFGNLASFGGSSVAENSYYVNGFNVTNLFKNLSYSQVPFYAIAEEQVITGGYGPEFGLSTGGVISINTAKGTNQWMAGGAMTWEPDALRSHQPKTYAADGSAFRDYSNNEKSQTIYDLWAGGPIIADRLFFYGIVELTQLESATEPNSAVSSFRNFETLEQSNPFGLAKVTWNIDDSNILDFTYINDTRKYTYRENRTAPDAEGFLRPVAYTGSDYVKEGGGIYVAGYTGYLSDDLTLTAQYGVLKSKREEYQIAANGTFVSYDGVVGNFDQPGCELVDSTAAWRAGNGGAPPACYITTTIPTAVGEDERKAGRIDLEYQVPGFLFGTHTGSSQDKGEKYQSGL